MMISPTHPVEAQSNQPTVLYVDDETDTALVCLLRLEGFVLDVARCGRDGLQMANGRHYDTIVLDLRLPDVFGLTVLERIVASGTRTPVVVVTGWYGEEEIEQHAFKAGAAAFMRKPLLPDRFVSMLRDLIASQATRPEAHRSDGGPPEESFGLVAHSEAARKLVQWIARIGPRSAHVLITGESGVGKELTARALHLADRRRTGAFVPINCGAIPDNLIETELFGHAKGAFTGAARDKPGLLEAGHGGTVFLDEIAELPAPMQVRLLRVLEDGEVRRLGETRSRHVDFRVIAATNRRIRDDLKTGRFRTDLYFRLAVATYHIPPLRDRVEDIEPLARYWLQTLAGGGGPAVTEITPGALALLRAYQWPGNVRELRNVLEYSVAWAAGPWVTEREVSEALAAAVSDDWTVPPVSLASEDCRTRLLAALNAHGWNRTATARSLGIDRTTLWRQLKRLGVSMNRGNG